MALNCDLNKRIFTFEGKDYSYDEFRALMYDGLLERIPELTAETKKALATEEGKAEVEQGLSLDEARRKLMEMREEREEGDKLKGLRKTLIDAVGRMTEERAKKMARLIAPKLTIVRHSTAESLRAAHPQKKNVNGFYDQAKKVIHVGPNGNVTHVIAHEVLHPIFDAFIGADEAKAARLYDELVKDERLAIFARFGQSYLNKKNPSDTLSIQTSKEEAIVDFLGAVADGKYDKELLGDNKFMQGIKEMLYRIMEFFGAKRPVVDITDVQTLKDLAKAIAIASRYSRAVAYTEPTIGEVSEEVDEMRADEAFNGIEEPKTPIGDTKTVMVDGVERTVFNSNGRPIHPTVEGVRNFWRWFGDSKVVDEQGRPLVVYHGTTKDFDSFELDFSARGFYFTDNADQAASFASVNNLPGQNVMAVYLSSNRGPIKTIDQARYFAVSDNSQIKSATGNYGRFDPRRAEISEMRADEAFNGIEEPKTPIGDTKTVMVDGKERTVFNSEGNSIHPTVEGVRNFWRFYKGPKDKEGRPIKVYHATHADIDAFRKTRGAHLGFHFGDIDAAKSRLEMTTKDRLSEADKEEFNRLTNKYREAQGRVRDLEEEFRGKRKQPTDEENAVILERIKSGENIGDVLGEYDYVPTKEELNLLSQLKKAAKEADPDIYAFALGANIGAYYISTGKLLRLPDVGNWGSVKKIKAELPWESSATTMAELADDIASNGYGGIVYLNAVEYAASPQDSYIVFDSNKIKSATGNYGRFDPKRAEISEMRADEGRVVPRDEYKKALDAAFKVIEESSERAWASLSRSEQATRMADAAVAAMKKSDWFKGQDIKQQRAAIKELRGEIADRLGVELAPKTEKQQQRAEEAAFKLGQKLGKQEETERNKKLIKDFAEWKAKQKAKTKAEKQALEEKYAEKFGKHKEEVKAIIKEQKKKLAEAKTNIRTAMAAANEAVSKALAGISAARKAGEKSARRKASLEQEQVAAAVVAVINENRTKGNLTFRQASMLTRAAAKVTFSNVKSVERFMDLLDKVIDDVAYATQISNIRKKQKIARGKIPAADAARVEQFVWVNAKKIDESLLYDYEKALDDLNLKVPRLAKMDAIYSQIVIESLPVDIDPIKISKQIDKLIESLENLDVKDVKSYREAIRLVNSIRRKTNDALLSESITQVEADEILKDIPDTQEKFNKVFAKQIQAIKDEYIAQINIASGNIDTTNMGPEVRDLVDSAKSFTENQLNELDPFDLDLLADLLDVVASEETVHVNMLAGVVARAETAGQGQRIADQLQFAPSVNITEGGWVSQRIRMAAKRSIGFWESALGLARVKAGAVYKFVFAELQRASVNSDRVVNAASLEFMRLRDKYDLEPGLLGKDPMIKLGMIITYLQEYDLINSKMAENNPEKGYGTRDWFSKSEMEKYKGNATNPKKVKAMMEFWEAMPKDADGNVSPKAVHDSFVRGDNRFLTENEIGFLNELLAWKEKNITPMQRFANELRGKPLDTIKYHMPRIRINSQSKDIPANKFFDSGTRRLSIESMSGKERKDFSVGPVETDLTKLFINNVDSVSVDYFYTPAVMRVNEVLDSAQRLSPDKMKSNDYISAIRQVAADALNHEFSHAKLNKYVRRVLTVRSVGILFGPLRPLQELVTAIISIPFRTGSPKKVYGKMKNAVAEYEQWFKKNEYVLSVMEMSKSAMTNREGFNKIYEFKRDGYEKKTKFEKLAFALTSWPERTQINISWMPVFEQEFKRESGVAFDAAAFKLNPKEYFKKHKQAFLSASATADNSYQKIVGPSTQFGARRKAVLNLDTNTNAGMMASWMSNWPSRSWWQLKDASVGFIMAEREARLTGYAEGDIRTDAASQAAGVMSETLVYSFLTNLRLVYGKAMATTIAILAASAFGDEDDDDEELSKVWDEANKEAMAGFAPSNLIQGGANSVISLATSPSGTIGRELYGLTVNLLLTAAENKKLGMDKQDAKFLREYMEKQMFRYGVMTMTTRYGGEDAVQKALYNTLPALSGAISQVYAVADAYKIAIPSMMKKVESGEELTLNEKEVYALLSLTINSVNLYGMLAGGVALPFGQDTNRMMKDLQKKHPGGQGLLLDKIPFGSTVK